MADKTKTLRVNFDAELRNFEGKPISDTAGPQEIVNVLVRAGVPVGQIDNALMAVQRFIGEKPPKDIPLTAADVVVAALKGVPEEGVSRTDIKERARIILRALGDQPVELLEGQKEIILAVLAKRRHTVEVQWAMEDILNGEAEAPEVAPDNVTKLAAGA